MSDAPLRGAGVLVTRPRRQAEGLVEAIEAAGGVAVRFPVIEARPRPLADVVADAGRLRVPDIAIFVSGNAVRFGLRFAGDARIAVVGPATAAAVEAERRSVDIRSPEGYNSEALLATPELRDVTGKVVRIIRGNGGRELLARALTERGAIVEYLEVYSRERPVHDGADVAQLCDKWRAGGIAVVTVMSVETLGNLVELLPADCLARLGTTPLVTPATRVIKEAGDRFPGIPTHLAAGPQAGDMLETIVACLNPGHPDE